MMRTISERGQGRGAIAVAAEDTNLADLLRVSLEPLTRDAAKDGIELRVVSLGDVPPILVDREKIAWCVTALVGNALRYVKHVESRGEAGGSVLVQVEYDEAAPDVVAVAVQDDGPGIKDDKLPYLFERRSGAMHAEGLSLTLIRDIVAAHGGEIVVETRHGEDEHGTSVTLRLPRKPPVSR